MTFEEALVELAAGKAILRSGWGMPNVRVRLVIPPPKKITQSTTDLSGNVTYADVVVDAAPGDYYLEMDTSRLTLDTPGVFRGVATWRPTWEDMISADWQSIAS